MLRAARFAGLLLAGTLPCATGCQATGLRLLSLIGMQKHPLSVALVTDKAVDAAQGFNPFPAYRVFQETLSSTLDRPVAIDVCFPFQAQAGFKSGWYDLADVTPTQLLLLEASDMLRVLAVSVDKQGRALHSAELLVATDSPAQTVNDVRGNVVAFGPVDDPLTHRAALQLLHGAGIKPADLSLDMLPLPGSLRHLPDGHAVVQAVLSGSAAAGFVDDNVWEALPEHDARAGAPAHDKLRSLGQTMALPARLVVAAPQLDERTVDRVRGFLLTVAQEHPAVMEPLTSSGYIAPSAEMLATCRALSATENAAGPTETQPAVTSDGAD